MNETRTKIGTWVGFLLILVWCLLPVVWIISLSFKGPTETAAGSPQFLPKEPTLQNYTDIFNNPRLPGTRWSTRSASRRSRRSCR